MQYQDKHDVVGQFLFGTLTLSLWSAGAEHGCKKGCARSSTSDIEVCHAGSSACTRRLV